MGKIVDIRSVHRDTKELSRCLEADRLSGSLERIMSNNPQLFISRDERDFISVSDYVDAYETVEDLVLNDETYDNMVTDDLKEKFSNLSHCSSELGLDVYRLKPDQESIFISKEDGKLINNPNEKNNFIYNSYRELKKLENAILDYERQEASRYLITESNIIQINFGKNQDQ